MTKKSLKEKTKIFKNTELISLTASGIEQAPENDYQKITPFTESISNEKNHPHIDTIKNKLTEGFLWFELFKRFDIEFFLDEDKFVKGFIKKSRDAKSVENRLKMIEESIVNMQKKEGKR